MYLCTCCFFTGFVVHPEASEVPSPAQPFTLVHTIRNHHGTCLPSRSTEIAYFQQCLSNGFAYPHPYRFTGVSHSTGLRGGVRGFSVLYYLHLQYCISKTALSSLAENRVAVTPLFLYCMFHLFRWRNVASTLALLRRGGTLLLKGKRFGNWGSEGRLWDSSDVAVYYRLSLSLLLPPLHTLATVNTAFETCLRQP